ncbi:MAG: helix-turn-helix transcriptional regulator [Proteobacteria bacterium]|nr:helix-turn-helix transcriptional regulator [Pseudomonadota bacterium]
MTVTDLPKFVTPLQIRAARALLDWTQIDLAKAAGYSTTTIWRVENGSPDAARALGVLVETFQGADIEFISEDDVIGVQLHQRMLGDVINLL